MRSPGAPPTDAQVCRRAKVDQLDALVLLRQDAVLRLDVAVHDAWMGGWEEGGEGGGQEGTRRGVQSRRIAAQRSAARRQQHSQRRALASPPLIPRKPTPTK